MLLLSINQFYGMILHWKINIKQQLSYRNRITIFVKKGIKKLGTSIAKNGAVGIYLADMMCFGKTCNRVFLQMIPEKKLLTEAKF